MSTLLKGRISQAYQIGQLMSWIYQKDAADFSQMTNLPSKLRNQLSAEFSICSLARQRRLSSCDGSQKLLLRAEDGANFECVLIPGPKRLTACLSSQVGCRLGCAFCATGAMGFVRNLSPAEMAGQLWHLKRLGQGNITHVVFMGMGEPLDNYENVLASARIINSPRGFGLGARHITISTAGLAPGIERLSREPEQFKLAISLNAADDRLRSRLMPINKRYPLSQLLPAARGYAAATGKMITFEYVLLAGINDRPTDAQNLGRLLRDIPSKVNLIPYNGPAGGPFAPPTPQAVAKFHRLLSARHPRVTIRASKGADISAACGMLRASCWNQEPKQTASEAGLEP